MDMLYTIKQSQLKDGKTFTIKSRAGDMMGLMTMFEDEPDTYDIAEDDSAWEDFLITDSFGFASDDDYEYVTWGGYETASTAESGDSATITMEFEAGDDEGEFDVEWKYGKKPNGFLRFLFWTVLLLGVAGGAAYYFMM